jgi:hypothetical protein
MGHIFNNSVVWGPSLGRMGIVYIHTTYYLILSFKLQLYLLSESFLEVIFYVIYHFPYEILAFKELETMNVPCVTQGTCL